MKMESMAGIKAAGREGEAIGAFWIVVTLLPVGSLGSVDFEMVFAGWTSSLSKRRPCARTGRRGSCKSFKAL